jgi:hypothetical protein
MKRAQSPTGAFLGFLKAFGKDHPELAVVVITTAMAFGTVWGLVWLLLRYLRT